MAAEVKAKTYRVEIEPGLKARLDRATKDEPGKGNKTLINNILRKYLDDLDKKRTTRMRLGITRKRATK
jgi:hypothetical protein